MGIDPRERLAREDFKAAVLHALELDGGDGLTDGYHTLNTFAAYGVRVSLEHIPGSAYTWAVELRLDPIHVCRESDGDVARALKEIFLLFVKELNRHPKTPSLYAWLTR